MSRKHGPQNYETLNFAKTTTTETTTTTTVVTKGAKPGEGRDA